MFNFKAEQVVDDAIIIVPLFSLLFYFEDDCFEKHAAWLCFLLRVLKETCILAHPADNQPLIYDFGIYRVVSH